MASNRAFSDTEVVTIAAVAAAAIGGIVVGLGRGQANTASPESTTDKLREITSAGLSRAHQHVPDRSELSNRLHDISSAAHRLPDPREADTSPIKDAFGALTDTLKKQDVGADFAGWLRQLLPADANPESLRDKARRIAHSAEERLPDRDAVPDVSSPLGSLAGLGAVLRRAMSQDESGMTDEPASMDVAAAVRHRVSDALGQVSEHLPTGDTTSDTRARAGNAVQRHVADPVSRAASSTKDVTKESLTALLWLSAGAGLVYFGLLSADRREQVKDALCGAVEQARLLAMDFQGYESEM